MQKSYGGYAMSATSNETTRIEQNEQSLNFICKLPSGWVFLSNMQFLRGYCILQAYPVVESINILEPKQRSNFLCDMALIGDALLEVTKAYRINYALLAILIQYCMRILFRAIDVNQKNCGVVCPGHIPIPMMPARHFRLNETKSYYINLGTPSNAEQLISKLQNIPGG
jgi:hypothetical protein